MIRAVLVDDDLYALHRLERMLREQAGDQVQVMASFQDPLLALTYLKHQAPDVLFLDIRMPGLNGFELLDLAATTADVIFVTAHDVYAIQAIRYSAFDYLLKPLEDRSLREALERFKNKQLQSNRLAQLNTLKFNLSQTQISHFKLLLPGQKENEIIPTQEITHCVAESNYTSLHLQKGKRVMASKTLGDIEQLLPPTLFLRIHKSYLINLDFLDAINAQQEVQLSNGVVLPVSRRRFQEVREALLKRP